MFRFSETLISRTLAAANKFLIFRGRGLAYSPCKQLTECNFFRVRRKSALLPQLRPTALNVFVWRNPELSVTVPVRPDGKISTPLVEDMVAAGKSPSQLATDIEHVLGEFVRDPNVTVIVGEFVGTFTEQIRVVGQATTPRSLPYRDRMTVLDAMIEVGGLTPQAAGNRAKLVRWENGKQVDIPVRLHDLLNKGKIDANMLLQPGDVLIIPESVF